MKHFFFQMVLMARTADIMVFVSLAIILNSVDHKEVRELQIIRYMHNATMPFCIDYGVFPCRNYFINVIIPG